MITFYLTIFTVLSPFLLWCFYLAVMALKRQELESPLKKPVLYVGTGILSLGYILDAYVNIVIMTPLLLELPRELTVTSRLKRHIKIDNSWGQKVAQWLQIFLDPFDPSGSHLS